MPRATANPSRRVLVGSWLGSTNLGDELVFRALTRRLRPYTHSIDAISVDPPATVRTHEVGAVGHTDVRALLAAAGSADAFVFGGGGLIQDVTSAYNLPYHLARVALARMRGLAVAGVGLGVAPLGRRISPALVRAAWPSGAPATVRDRGSQDVFRSLGIDAVLAADLVFGLDPPDAAPEDCIAVSLRPWHGGGGGRVSTSWRAGFDTAMIGTLAAALDDLAVTTGLSLRFVAFQPDRDGVFHQAVADRLRRARDVELMEPSIDTVLATMARSRLVVSTRYHGLVGALLAGRPAVGLSYTHKVGRLADDAPASVTTVAHALDAVGGLVAAGETLLRRDPDVAADRDRLRERERQNDSVLEAVLG